MANLSTLAKREALAEQARGHADAEWRRAWWATTTALGQIPAGDKTALSDAITTVCNTLGHSRNHVSRRARTGRVFTGIHHLETLPPRMAVEAAEVASARGGQQLADEVRLADEDGLSLREFKTRLTGKHWADTPAGVSAETIDEIVAHHPEAVARAVIANPKARAETRQRDADMLRQEHVDDLGPSPQTAEGKAERARLAHANAAEAAISAPIYQAASLLQSVQREWDLYASALSAGERGQISRTLRDIVVAAESLALNLGLEEVTR